MLARPHQHLIAELRQHHPHYAADLRQCGKLLGVLRFRLPGVRVEVIRWLRFASGHHSPFNASGAHSCR